jgi:hypothetical protein
VAGAQLPARTAGQEHRTDARGAEGADGGGEPGPQEHAGGCVSGEALGADADNTPQDRFGRELTALETQWTNLISSVLQIEMANVALEAELGRLRGRAGELGEIA